MLRMSVRNEEYLLIGDDIKIVLAKAFLSNNFIGRSVRV